MIQQQQFDAIVFYNDPGVGYRLFEALFQTRAAAYQNVFVTGCMSLFISSEWSPFRLGSRSLNFMAVFKSWFGCRTVRDLMLCHMPCYALQALLVLQLSLSCCVLCGNVRVGLGTTLQCINIPCNAQHYTSVCFIMFAMLCYMPRA